MLVEGIKSRPVYGRLVPGPGSEHILVLEGPGAEAALEMAPGAPPEFFGRSRLVLIGVEDELQLRLSDLQPRTIHPRPTISSAVPVVRHLLAGATMTTRLYLAGTEPMIGRMIQLADEAGMDHESIQTEHRGSTARRVQCVHCKGIMENVRTQPVPCSHCGILLLVRDHYSRRIGAFQGVCIDAEAPGTGPAPQEIFP